ncbi:hypothetical protein MCUN1_003451 [Malassezia cuniculi]|uniref:hydroxyisourate hydrolase n=1 Tax=Malassezia cuniculi TaxID=948313 RepID=A0AAF0J7T8_9BASI|nr:hypothetical protein MCUN1_003451 [Malassezia cuniculi]
MPYRILIINPNTTVAMTDALRPLVEGLAYNDTVYTFWTAPEGPASINDEIGCKESAEKSLPHLIPLIAEHDAFLVACYSPHPLVTALRHETSTRDSTPKPVIGILEASVSAALNTLDPDESFGVVSTGKVWEYLLGARICSLLGSKAAEAHSGDNDSAPYRTKVFAGVETTGLNATELHDAPEALVKTKVQEAAQRLLGMGSPASGVPFALYASDASKVAEGKTNSDGRTEDLAGIQLEKGAYTMTFDTAAYFASQHVHDYFYPKVDVHFHVADASSHYHVPLILSPFGFSTYRGS